MNTDLARHNMIEQQIRPWEVLDDKVLRTLAQVPRENFVPSEKRALAFADLSIPFGDIAQHPSQRMLEPKLEARLVQSLSLESWHSVLVVGAGTGYVCGLIAQLAKSVLAYEIAPQVADQARRQLAQAGINQVVIKIGDGLKPEEGASFDRILVTGAMESLPKTLIRQLNLGGKLIAIIGVPPIMQAIAYNDCGEIEKVLFDTMAPPLVYPRLSTFVF